MTTIHAINSGIIKLSVLTPVITVYRGMSGLELPKELKIASKFGGKLGIEYSFMSTTTNKNIAIEYGQDKWSGHDLGYVLEFSMDTLNRGALIQWLSQYPGEAEVLFAPLTGMEAMKESAIFMNGKRLRHLHFRPTCNQRAVLIEELVARRKLQCEGMAEGMLSELKKAGMQAEVVQFMRDHREIIKKRSAEWFNIDEAFRFVLNTTLDLKKVLEAVGTSTKKATKICMCDTGCQAFEQLMTYFDDASDVSCLVQLGLPAKHHAKTLEADPETLRLAGAAAITNGSYRYIFDSQAVSRCEPAKRKLLQKTRTAAKAVADWEALPDVDRYLLMNVAKTLTVAGDKVGDSISTLVSS